MEEVAPMVNYTIREPSLLPSLRLRSVGFVAAVRRVRGGIAAPQSAPAPRVHQVQIQAELAQARVRIDGSNGTTGFVGNEGLSVTTMTDGGSGAPPRGRPV
jgi:hypothetical protein